MSLQSNNSAENMNPPMALAVCPVLLVLPFTTFIEFSIIQFAQVQSIGIMKQPRNNKFTISLGVLLM